MNRTWVVRACLPVVLAAALGASAAPVAAQEQKPSGEPAKPLPSGDLPKPLVIPEKEKNRQNPVPNVPEDRGGEVPVRQPVRHVPRRAR
jgi:hypothetical protein